MIGRFKQYLTEKIRFVKNLKKKFELQQYMNYMRTKERKSFNDKLSKHIFSDIFYKENV